MAEILIERETEIDRGWSFDVVARGPGGVETRYRVRLSWADYNLWSGGRVAPERVARAAMRFMTERAGAGTLGEEFDLAALRRHDPAIDRELPGMLE